MATASTPTHRLAASVRLVLAMFRLYADIESGFGKAVLDILKKQYPDQKIDANASTIGHKMMAIVRKQNQYDDDRSMDAIQDFLTYITTGSKFETDEEGKAVKDEEGKAVPRKTQKAWNFSKDFPTWQEALDAIFSNLRTRGISKSIDTQKRKKREKSVDDAFGARGEGGGAPEGGEGRMPTPEEGQIGRALDDSAAIKEFYDLIDSYVPELKASLPSAERALFDLVFEDDVGGFGSDIKENMNQASALKDKLMGGSDEDKSLYEKNAKRWSGFVGDTRKKLLNNIWNFIEKHMTPGDYEALYDNFFSDTTPQAVEKIEGEKEKKKTDYQRGIDERKIGRFKWMEKEGKLSDKDKKSYEALAKKLKGQGVDVDKIEPLEPKKGKGDKEESQESQTASIAKRLATYCWS